MKGPEYMIHESKHVSLNRHSQIGRSIHNNEGKVSTQVTQN